MNLGIVLFWLLMTALAFYAMFCIASVSLAAGLAAGLSVVGSLIWGIADMD